MAKLRPELAYGPGNRPGQTIELQNWRRISLRARVEKWQDRFEIEGPLVLVREIELALPVENQYPKQLGTSTTLTFLKLS